jgi:D-methionine transport system substrate-binding protein
MRMIGLITLILFIVACSKPSPNTLIVGTISGPETELVETAQKIAWKQHGVTVKIVAFNDYNLPNEALQDGSLDANVYQHIPYLKAATRAHGYSLIAVAKTFLYPMGVYSIKIKSLKHLPNHATIALPNDPSNEGRALLLLQKVHLIKLKKIPLPNVQDIVSNPKNIRFKALDAAQLPRVLADVDAAVINTNFAVPAGLSPSRDALLIEGKDSLYANVVVTRRNNDKKEQLALFIQSLHSDEVQKKAKELFGDAVIPAW